MRTAFASVFVVALAAIVGCDSGTPGGPGATTHNTKKPVVGEANETFSLDMPNLGTTLKQGEMKTVTIGIKRGKNLDTDVTLKFSDLPKGVTVEPAAPSIKHGENEAKVNIKAAEDAALGTFTVNVVGHPSTGTDATNTLKVVVEKK